MDVEIVPLSRYPQFVPVAADWHFREWGHTDPGGSSAGWAAGLARQASADQLPGTVIALADGALAGVVCLVPQDMPGYEPSMSRTPWIKGLYVAESHRRRGLGGLLVRHCESWAAALGFADLYLYTERGSGAQNLYTLLGWTMVETARYDDIDVTVMSKALPA